MKDVETTIVDTVVTKKAVNRAGGARLAHEKEIYRQLAGSLHIAHVADFDGDLKLQKVEGDNAKEWLDFHEDWTCNPQEAVPAIKRLGQYVAAEMDFIKRGVLYRDLNLEHLIFAGDTAVLIDLEEAVVRQSAGSWAFDSRRGTWETMALEEFKGQGELTERTATYRVAVVAHLALTGRLPFPRKAVPLRPTTYAWRRNHPATVARELPSGQRKVFSAALAREPARRHKDPQSFLDALQQVV